MKPKPRKSPNAAPRVSALDAEARQLVARVCTAFHGVLSALGVSTLRACDLEAKLRLHKTMAWKIFRVAHSSDPLDEAGCIPGPEGIEIFLRAAARHDVPELLLREVREAVKGFRSLAELHADDRPSLDAMLRGMSPRAGAPSDLRSARRAAYRCASYTWGEQTQARILSVIYAPTDPSTCDVVTIRGVIGLRRMREGVQLALTRTIEHDSGRPNASKSGAQAIEPEGVAGGVPLLRAFCSSVPEVVPETQPDGSLVYRFGDGRVGNAAAITAFTGDIRRNLVGAIHRDEANAINAVLMRVLKPTALSVVEMWAPPGLWRCAPIGHLLCALERNPVTSPPETWRELVLVESAEHRGCGIDAAELREVPEYPAVIARVFSRLGWNVEDFESHRMKVEYPVVGTCIGLTVELDPVRKARSRGETRA